MLDLVLTLVLCLGALVWESQASPRRDILVAFKSSLILPLDCFHFFLDSLRSVLYVRYITLGFVISLSLFIFVDSSWIQEKILSILDV